MDKIKKGYIMENIYKYIDTWENGVYIGKQPITYIEYIELLNE